MHFKLTDVRIREIQKNSPALATVARVSCSEKTEESGFVTTLN